jgi:hypothetical protein
MFFDVRAAKLLKPGEHLAVKGARACAWLPQRPSRPGPTATSRRDGPALLGIGTQPAAGAVAMERWPAMGRPETMKQQRGYSDLKISTAEASK